MEYQPEEVRRQLRSLKIPDGELGKIFGEKGNPQPPRWGRIHLQGYLEVKEFVKKGGDIRTLYLGKIGIQHLPLVENLLRKKILKPAKYLPRYLPRCQQDSTSKVRHSS